MEEESSRSSNRFIYIISIIAAVGGFLFGYDTGIIAGALVYIQNEFHPSTFISELMVSSVVLGAFLSAIASGFLANKYGRRRMLIFSAWAFIFGTIIASFATNIESIIIGRTIIGIAIGISSYTVPLFISEMAPKEKRGALVLINAVTITGGEAVAFLVDYSLVSTQSWRLMFVTGLLPAVILLVGMWKMPPTPRWCMLKGWHDKAHLVLKKIRCSDNIFKEINEMRHHIGVNCGAWRQLFSRKIRGVLFVGLGLGILQQFAGINTVMYYGPTIFKSAGITEIKIQVLATFCLGLVNMLMSLLAMLLVDKIGRRRLLLGGCMLAAVSLWGAGWVFSQPMTSSLSQWLIFTLMICYIIGFALGLGSIFWLIIAEIYPLNLRGLAMSFVTGVQWAANFVVSLTFLSILQSIGLMQTFQLYALMCTLALIFCYRYVPETTGKTLEAIQDEVIYDEISEVENFVEI